MARESQRLVRLETKLDALCDFIMDNGQPGALSKLDGRIQRVEQKLDEKVEAVVVRVEKLEGWRRWVHGVVAAFVFLFSGIATLWKLK